MEIDKIKDCKEEGAIKSLDKGNIVSAIMEFLKIKDRELVMSQTSCNEELAIQALDKHKGDIVSAINEIKDLILVMSHTFCNEEVAIQALDKHKGDIVCAIMEIEKIKYCKEEVDTGLVTQTCCTQKGAIKSLDIEEISQENFRSWELGQ